MSFFRCIAGGAFRANFYASVGALSPLSPSNVSLSLAQDYVQPGTNIPTFPRVVGASTYNGGTPAAANLNLNAQGAAALGISASRSGGPYAIANPIVVDVEPQWDWSVTGAQDVMRPLLSRAWGVYGIPRWDWGQTAGDVTDNGNYEFARWVYANFPVVACVDCYKVDTWTQQQWLERSVQSVVSALSVGAPMVVPFVFPRAFTVAGAVAGAIPDADVTATLTAMREAGAAGVFGWGAADGLVQALQFGSYYTLAYVNAVQAAGFSTTQGAAL